MTPKPFCFSGEFWSSSHPVNDQALLLVLSWVRGVLLGANDCAVDYCTLSRRSPVSIIASSSTSLMPDGVQQRN